MNKNLVLLIKKIAYATLTAYAMIYVICDSPEVKYTKFNWSIF